MNPRDGRADDRSGGRTDGRVSLGRLTWTDLRPQRPRLLVVPLGSCEQHGPHLPLDTDTLLAEAYAAALSERRSDTMVAPTITIGASGEHSDFPGTLSIGTEALAEVVIELGRSAMPEPSSGRPMPFAAMLLVNGHGGNVAALGSAVAVLRAESRVLSAWHPRVEGGDPHAGLTETSLMLHLHPERVRMSAAVPGSTARFSDIEGDLTTGGLAKVSPNGVLGDPTGATAEIGATLFEGLCSTLTLAADELLDPVSGAPNRPARHR